MKKQKRMNLEHSKIIYIENKVSIFIYENAKNKGKDINGFLYFFH